MKISIFILFCFSFYNNLFSQQLNKIEENSITTYKIEDVFNQFFKENLFNNRKLLSEIENAEKMYSQGEFIPAMKLYYEILKKAQEQGDSISIGKCYMGLSNLNFRMADNKESLNYSLKASEIFYLLADSVDYIKASMLTAQVYLGLFRYQEAQEIYTQMLELSEKMNDSLLIADNLNHLGALFVFQGNYSKGLPYYKKAMKINARNNNLMNLSIDYANIGELYRFKENYSISLEFFYKAKDLAEELKFTSLLIFIYYNLGEVYSNLNENKKALLYYNKSLKQINDNNEIREKTNIYNLLSKYYERIGHYDTALFYYRSSVKVRDSLHLLYNIFHGEELKVKYEIRKVKQDLKSVLLEKKLQDQKIKSDRETSKLELAFFVIIIVVIILAYFLKKSYDNKKIKIKLQELVMQKTNELTVENKIKETLIHEIHHRVKNNLQTISSLIHLQLKTIKVQSQKNVLYNTQIRINSMALIYEMLYSEDNINNLISIKDYLKKLVHSIDEMSNDYRTPIKFNIFSDDIVLKINQSIILGMLTTEIVTNAIKYAFENVKSPEITVIFKEENNKLVYCIKDNGKGIKNSKLTDNKKSMGFKLIDIFSRQLDAELIVENDNGLKISLLIPKK